MSSVTVIKLLEACSRAVLSWLRPAADRPAHLRDLDARTLRDIGVLGPGRWRTAVSGDDLPR